MPKLKKLTVEEANRLRAYCAKNGGQDVVAVSLGTSSSRISRNINRHNAPQKWFHQKLVELKIIKQTL